MQSVIQQQIAAYCGCIHEWNASYEEYAKSVGLSYASLSVLSTAYSVKNCTQKTLCELCFLPKQSVHSIITAFYQKGWIYLQELPEDRRTKIIHFTDKGRIRAEEILLRIHSAETQAMQCLSDEDREALIRITKQYVAACRKSTALLK